MRCGPLETQKPLCVSTGSPGIQGCLGFYLQTSYSPSQPVTPWDAHLYSMSSSFKMSFLGCHSGRAADILWGYIQILGRTFFLVESPSTFGGSKNWSRLCNRSTSPHTFQGWEGPMCLTKYPLQSKWGAPPPIITYMIQFQIFPPSWSYLSGYSPDFQCPSPNKRAETNSSKTQKWRETHPKTPLTASFFFSLIVVRTPNMRSPGLRK